VGRQLLIATRNPGKVNEFSEMLGTIDVEWMSLDDIGIALEVEETGSTFEDNAVLKALAYAKETGLLTLADDSGLEVDALDGEPGVYTARYGGPGLSHIQRYEYLLSKLVHVPEEQRTARFRCAIALAGGRGTLYGTASGTCEGVIAFSPKGKGGFGYDPVFYLPERRMTMAQLTANEKHAISHRGKALKEIEPLLRAVLS
jgi:XTP/dITP diphosphohydrolase